MVRHIARDAFKRLLKGLKAIIPLSPRGLLLCVLSIAILSIGTARVDLAALFWGSSFLLVSMYAILASHLTRVLLRRRRDIVPGFLSVSLPSTGLSPGDQGEARISVDVPRSIPPGFSVRFLLPLAWHSRRIDSIATGLAPGGNSLTLLFRALARGAYQSEKVALEIRDVLGFTSNAVEVPLEESLKVFPAVHEEARLLRVMEEGGEAVKFARRRRRSEDLLEARKYFPGDDIRKLNWKVFAHLNELFLRIGEETPPPESRILFVLDSTSNPLVPRIFAADYLDGMVESCASTMSALIARRIDPMLSWPGARECRAFTEDTRSELLSALAGIWWTEAEWRPELPSRTRMHAIVISSPGSPGLKSIMEALSNRGWSVSLLLKNTDLSSSPRRLRPLDLLFVPERATASSTHAPRPNRRSARRKEAAAFGEALARELARYRSQPWKVRHAEEI